MTTTRHGTQDDAGTRRPAATRLRGFVEAVGRALDDRPGSRRPRSRPQSRAEAFAVGLGCDPVAGRTPRQGTWA